MSEELDFEEQERVMREMMKKEMITKIEEKINGGDHFLIGRIKKMLLADAEEEKMNALNKAPKTMDQLYIHAI